MVFYFGCPKLTSTVIKNGVTISTNPGLYHSVPAPPQFVVLAIPTFITFNFLEHTLSSLHNLFSCWHYIWNMVCVTDLFSSFRYHISIIFVGLALVVYTCNPHTQETETKRLSLIPSGLSTETIYKQEQHKRSKWFHSSLLLPWFKLDLYSQSLYLCLQCSFIFI